MHLDQQEDLAAAIVEFARFLQSCGIPGDLRRTMTALEAATAIDAANQRTFASALQTALCSTREEWELFPELFQQFWGGEQPGPRAASNRKKPGQKNRTESQGSDASGFIEQHSSEASVLDTNAKKVYGASAQQRLTKVDFGEVPQDDLAALEDLSLRLLRRMSLRLSRRLGISNLADRIDLRRSIRRSIAHGGEPIALAYKARKRRKNRLVILLDISGSMNLYSLFFVRFAYALQARFRRVNTFLFSTDIVEVTDLLRTRTLPAALRGLSQRAAGWSGGTKIGESLRQFNQIYGKKLLSRDTVFIILSDGWDTGEPDSLVAQMRAARRSAQRILWLNPLLGLKDYRPITRGMAAALPHVDVFAPAHNLESLLALEKHL